jgi:hypothetical protein
MKWVGPFMSNILYTNLLFLFNCIRLRQPFYWQNINQPNTLNEKINNIKFLDRNPLAPIVADKWAVREFIREKIGEEYLVPILAVFDSPEQIDFSILPDKFVMKLNNGSGYNLICSDKSALVENVIRRNFRKAFNKDIYVASREWHYKLIQPKIIVEKLLGDNIIDYKIFCDGEKGPIFIQIDVDRFISHKRNLYNTNWELLDISYVYPQSEKKISSPVNLDKMLELARKLSLDFKLSRIDFYEEKGKIYFGEITLHPEGGVGPMDSFRSDLKLGELISF